MAKIRTTECDECHQQIFQGETYYFDDYFDVIYCSKSCSKQFYIEQADRMYEEHFESNVYEQDEL